MVFSVCVVLLVTVWQASAQAPGDEDPRCVNERAQANDVYPPFTNMLMDSRNYEELISGSRPHWQQLDADGTGSGWTSTLGGLCAYEARVCDFRESTSQDNWVFTQYISYRQAREVFVNISAGFTECRLAQNPRCNQLYVDMYRYERNGRNDVAARTTSNYGQRIQRIQQPNGFGQRTYRTYFPFTPTGNFNGFYIGIRDTGTCVNFQRIQIYYRASPRRTDGLIMYPEIALPILTSNTVVTGIAACAANSRNLTSLQVTCFTDGRCEDIATCACNPGYEYVATTPAQCRACTSGNYKAGTGNTVCQSCPANTTMDAERASICNCNGGHYRTNEERPEHSCTAPPSSAQQVNARVGNTTAVVEWNPPLSDGGRNDTYYVVKYREVSSLGPFIKAGQTSESPFTVHRLKPVTQYIIRIIAENGVSDQEPGSEDERTTEIAVNTTEGIPGPSRSVQVVDNTVVVWQKPDTPNGIITGYEVGISTTPVPTPDQITIVGRINDAERNFFVINRDDVPASIAYVQVRAINSAGSGNWSAAVQFVVTSPTTATPMECPTTATPMECPTTATPMECPTTATPMECPTTATPTVCPTCPECTSPTTATYTECPTTATPTVCPTCPECTSPTTATCTECPTTTTPTVCPTCPECTSPTPATCTECPTTTTPTVCPTCPECTTPTTATPTKRPTSHVTSPATLKTDATAVTVGVTNENKTDLVLTTNPTDDATDPAIITMATKPPTHTSTRDTTTTADITVIAVSNDFLKVPLQVASGYVIITAIATFAISTVLILPFVIIITCLCYRHALHKHKSKAPFKFSIKKNGA